MKRNKQFRVLNYFLTAVVLLLSVDVANANFPKNGSVTVWLYNPYQVTSKWDASHKYMSFEELVEAGVNVVQIATNGESWYYNIAEWIEDAHEHGIYVAGFLSHHHGTVQVVELSSKSAALGVDFMLIDEPLKGWDGNCLAFADDPFNESAYNEIKLWAYRGSMHDECPVIVTDVDCNHKIMPWSELDGVYNEIYSDGWMNSYLPPLVTYKNQNPSKYTGAWVWLLEQEESGMHWDRKYLEAVWNNTKNVGLFAWNMRPASWEGVAGTNWPARVEVFKQVVGKGSPVAEWQSFSPAEAVNTSAPDCEVQVRNAGVGLDPASVECYYAIDEKDNGNYRWIRHYDVSATGTKGTEDWVTITAKGVPFEQVSDVNNNIMFKITNTYSDGYFRGPQTFKRIYTVNIAETDWSNLSNKGVVKKLPADLFIDVQNSSGLDIASVKTEYSTDGGETWNVHPAECSGETGSTDIEMVTVKDVPFKKDQAGLNKIRFSIKNSSGTLLKSTDFAVKVETGPVISDFLASRDGDKLDFSVNLSDESGIAAGSREVPVREETLLLLPLVENTDDISGNGFDGTKVDASFVETESWTSEGGNKKALKMNGIRSRVYNGFGYLGRQKGFTLSGWINSGNKNNYVVFAMGDTKYYGSLIVQPRADHILVTAKNIKEVEMTSLQSAAGSFTHDAWHHIVVSWDGTTGNLYIDGNLAASEDWSEYSIYMMKPFHVGMAAGWAVFFDGMVSDVQLLDRGMSDAQIAADYYSGSYRLSSDGGTTWSDWSKAEIEGANGAKTATLSVTGAALSTQTDSLNRVEFAVRDINGNASSREFILMGDDAVPVHESEKINTTVSMYPNPFRNNMNISFELKETQQVELAAYGMDGRKVNIFQSKVYKPGVHTVSWNGKASDGSELLSGQYLVKVRIGNRAMVRRVLKL
ncbi:MAG: T9SS type A sorting domain-containing protein [Fibrobacteria bacterium]|nr:T9SS type A sorting domain-containing protein [Fibrobacteria bacterium]